MSLGELDAMLGPEADARAVDDTPPPSPGGPARFTLVVGGTADDRRRLALARARVGLQGDATATVVVHADVRTAPFGPPLADSWPPTGPLVVIVLEFDRACPHHQVEGTRLVLTQPAYQVQQWLDVLDRRPHASLVVTADLVALGRDAEDIAGRRGPWARASTARLPVPANEAKRGDGTHDRPSSDATVEDRLAAAFAVASPLERLEACRRVCDDEPASPVAWVALASACMEHLALPDALHALETALRLAPDWGAAHYELGKLQLRLENVPAACAAFARATTELPTFSPAFGNLGATLGELDRPAEALAAFEHARRFDPFGVQLVNNIGVVNRELGRLEASEAAFEDVVRLAPDFVFGHYNLGHTRFLAGRFAQSVAAYEEGQARDPQRNAVQAARSAFAYVAAGRPDRAVPELRRALRDVTADRRSQLIDDCREIAGALASWQPDLPGLSAMIEAMGEFATDGG